MHVNRSAGEFTSACDMFVRTCDRGPCCTNSTALTIEKTQFGQPDAVHKSSIWQRGAAAGTAVIENRCVLPSIVRRRTEPSNELISVRVASQQRPSQSTLIDETFARSQENLPVTFVNVISSPTLLIRA